MERTRARGRRDERARAPRDQRASEKLFEALALEILRGDLREGDALASERALEQRFGVSRATIREAVHKLADAGLVEVRRGAATVLLDADRSIDPRVMALRYRAPGARERREIGERRMLQGLGILFLVEKRAAPTELAPLVAEVAACAARGARRRDVERLDELFWMRLAELTHNRILAREVAWWFRNDPGRSGGAGLPDAPRVAFYGELLRRLTSGERATELYLATISALLPA